MPTFLGFLINTKTKEEFVAPTEAEMRDQAEYNFNRQYPAPYYNLLTVYARNEMDSILTNLDRWPGLPSKVQPSLDQLLQHVSVSRSLPPLHQPQANQPAFDGARVEQVREAVKGSSPEIQALAARLLAATGTPAPKPTLNTHTSTPPAYQTPAGAYGKAVSTTPVPSPQAMAQAKNTPRPSLIDVLKNMR